MNTISLTWYAMSTGDKEREKDEELKLNVTELVEFSARSGNLFDYHDGPTSLEGIRGHQKIQRQRDASWEKEYVLKQQLHLNGVEISLQGRVDLLSFDMINPIVEEIKTTYFAPSQLPEAKKQLHWAQAKVYAYLYCLESKSFEHVDVRVTWFNVTTQRTETQCTIVPYNELKHFTHELLNIYVQWHKTHKNVTNATVSTARSLAFPFPDYRPGQYELAKSVYHAVKNKYSLLVESPTGTGKTLSVLFPAIKSLGESVTEQIVYLTLKGSAKAVAEKAVAVLGKDAHCIPYIVIHAKDKVCPCKTSDDSQTCIDEEGVCTRTIGFFDRLPDARYACIREKKLSKEKIRSIAEKHHICPFELSIHMARWLQLVICDVNYVFDPQIHQAYFDQNCSRRVFLIDEVHNLPDRGQSMFSAALSTSELTNAEKNIGKSPAIRSLIDDLKDQLMSLSDVQHIETPPQSVVETLETLLDQLQKIQQDKAVSGLSLNPEFTSFVRNLIKFKLICEKFNRSYVCIVKTQGKHITLVLFCVDASGFLSEYHRCARASIGFSATLTPVEHYIKLTGLEKKGRSIAIGSAFPQKNQLTLACNFIDTRWGRREHSANLLTELIARTYHTHPGKYLVFFPSYAYMESIIAAMSESFPNIGIVSQKRESEEVDRQQFLANFFQSGSPVIGFAILGGVFAEGVDFVGDALLGTIIVSTGMPQPNIEQKHMESHASSQGLDPFQTVYQIPGMIRVAQTAGRVIRSETDKGVVILVDPRFSNPSFVRFMPKHWAVEHCYNQHDTDEKITDFWDSHNH